MLHHAATPTLLAILTVAVISACDRSADPAPTEAPPRLVRTLQVALTNEGDWREFPGIVDAERKAGLSFRVGGKVIEMLANEGDQVGKGDLLARLDDTDYKIQLESREAEYASAHADYLRGEELVKTGVISKSDFNKLQAQDATSKASRDSAQQNVEYTHLIAPFDGEVAVRHVDKFEEVNAQQIIYTLHDTSSLVIKIHVPESLMIRVREGARPEVVAEFKELPDKQFPLTFKEVSTQADASTNTFAVTFTMASNGGFNILPGMSAKVRGKPSTHFTQQKRVFYVPPHAVLEDDKGRFVYVAEPESGDRGIVQRRDVETGRLSQQGLEIVSGLVGGDHVITAGMSKMQTGMTVRMRSDSPR